MKKLSESREKYAQIELGLQVNRIDSEQICQWILMWEDKSGWTLSLEEELKLQIII